MVKTVAQEIRELGDRLSALYDEPAVVEDVAMLDQVMDKVIEDCKNQDLNDLMELLSSCPEENLKNYLGMIDRG
mgnify:CR=1 FL=1